MLTHPGPSLLVTAVTVGAGAIAVRGVPSTRLALQLTFIMLPAQLAFGAANDAFDAALDRTTKPHKPIVRHAVSRRTAMAISVAGVGISLAVTASTVPRALPLALLGIVAGLSYDLGLKRTPFSVVTWWAGFLALPVGVNVVAGTGGAALAWAVPLTALLALMLHIANSMPDLGGDAADGVVSLPVLLGRRAAEIVMITAGLGVAALACLTPRPGPSATTLAAAALLVGVLTLCSLVAPLRSRPFRALAPASAILAVAWLAAVAG
jgi:4-hydroxybenzoate polyprenyltransferase